MLKHLKKYWKTNLPEKNKNKGFGFPYTKKKSFGSFGYKALFHFLTY